MKKGASEIISSVLMIAIVVVIAAIVINFSFGIVEKQKQEAESFSPYYDAEIGVLTDMSSFSPTATPAQPLEFGVRRLDNEGNVSGVRFTFYDDKGNVYSHDIYDNPPNQAGITNTYSIKPEDINLANFLGIQKVSINLLYSNRKATSVLDEINLD